MYYGDPLLHRKSHQCVWQWQFGTQPPILIDTYYTVSAVLPSLTPLHLLRQKMKSRIHEYNLYKDKPRDKLTTKEVHKLGYYYMYL